MAGRRDDDAFASIRELYRRDPRKVVFFVGAGLSMPLFPSWRAFMEEVVTEAERTGRLNAPVAELRDRIARGQNYLDVADACIQALGRGRYREILERIFFKSFEVQDVPAPYRELFALAPSLIVTTNYDRIPDIAGQGRYTTFTHRKIPEFMRAIHRGAPAVLKLHGDISDQDSIVLGASDYARIEADSHVQSALQTILSSRNVIFLGFSLNDPHITHLLSIMNQVAKHMPLEHYAVLSNAQVFDVNRFEERYSIRVASYTPSTDDHPEIEVFLRSIAPAHAGPDVTLRPLSAQEFSNHVARLLRDDTGHDSYMITSPANEEHSLRLTVVARGQTQSEIQREILAIIKVLGSAPTTLTTARVSLSRGRPSLTISESFTVFLECVVPLTEARRYSTSFITDRQLWSTLAFEEPEPIGFPQHGRPRIVPKPFIGI